MEPAEARTALDWVVREKLSRSFDAGVAAALMRQTKALAIAFAVAAVFYATYCVAGLHAAATWTGTMHGLRVRAPVSIVRDGRGIPHIRASSDRDMYFAEGFAQGSDRLAQMDLLRRYAYGTLAEIVGPIQLRGDIAMRYLDVRDIVRRQYAALSHRDRDVLVAFSDGVNAAMLRQPLPFEFRVLMYEPEPWTPQDSLAVVLAISSSLDDSPSNVLARDEEWRKLGGALYARTLPLSDSRYDVALDAEMSRPRTDVPLATLAARLHGARGEARGSNAWAAGARRTRGGGALLANDPHLDVSIPGMWYVLEMRSAHVHVAGVTIAGVPGIILGHNEHLAWATTNGMAASFELFHAPRLERRFWTRETFRQRFGRDVTRAYYRAPAEFGIPGSGDDVLLARWPMYGDTRSPLQTVLRLDAAGSIRDAFDALRTYRGAAQNFLFADDRGRVAYHFAGPVANDSAWGRYVRPARDAARVFADVPFDRLPSAAASSTGIFVSANNKMYDANYPYRLSPMFAPPYRAYRIAQLLHARTRYDVRYFAQMQLDVVSPAELEFARRIVTYARRHPNYLAPPALDALQSWDGSYRGESVGATVAHALRTSVYSPELSPYAAFLNVRAPDRDAQVIPSLRDVSPAPRPWAQAGEVALEHPFGAVWFPYLSGAVLRGDGDEFTIHVQTPDLAQSFRAVWDAGNWDASGLSIPTGVSGEPGSSHYGDQSIAWSAGRLEPLPFSARGVAAATREVLTLMP